MTEQQATRQRRLDREKAAYRYTTALDNGDIDTIATVLQQAERDPELEQMILGIHGAYAAEDGSASAPGEVEIPPFSLRSLSPAPALPPGSTLPPPVHRHSSAILDRCPGASSRIGGRCTDRQFPDLFCSSF